MKRLVFFSAIVLAAVRLTLAQQVSSSTVPSVVNVFLESPVDSAQLQPYLKIIKKHPGSLEGAQAHLAIAMLQYNNRAYSAAVGESVSLKVFDVLGRELARLVNEQKEPGSYTVVWDAVGRCGLQLPSGIYFYRMEVGKSTAVRKMIVLR
jgi:hypothetical protein